MTPGSLEAKHLEAADLLLNARRTATPIADLPADLKPTTLEEAYAIQDKIAAVYGTIGGWKIGAPTPEATPIFAPMPQAWIAASGSTLAGITSRYRGLEAEIAFLIGEDLPPRANAYTMEEVVAAIRSCHPAIEVIESGLDEPTLPEVRMSMLADLQMHGGFIHGPAVADWQSIDFTTETVSLSVDGVVRIERTGSNTSGNLMRLLPFLANEGAARTHGLKRGQFITTGSWTGLVQARAGSDVNVHFGTAVASNFCSHNHRARIEGSRHSERSEEPLRSLYGHRRSNLSATKAFAWWSRDGKRRFRSGMTNKTAWTWQQSRIIAKGTPHMTPISTIPGVELTAPLSDRYATILTPEALDFIVKLQRAFNGRRIKLLEARVDRQARLDAGEKPDFLPDTAEIRNAEWQVAPLPQDLLDRRVEITGPVDRKMIINALNSGAKVFMADFEDSTTPTWDNLLDGQINLRDAIRRTITFEAPAVGDQPGKSYKLSDNPAVLFVRARGWHLEEAHILVDGDPMSGSLFDFGLYLFHNAKEFLARHTGPYFYLPKLESHLEARLWNDTFVLAETLLDIPQGSIKATVLIETILATFEMDEILYELRDHSAGLNCGRWDYIFSFIKKFAGDTSVILPDRSQVTMATHFMRSYSKLAIKTCHRRGVSAMGGMSAFIPIKSDPAANERALAQVRIDKEREATDGHDGTWVAHPGLVPIALEVFDRIMPQPNQIDKQLTDLHITAADLLKVPEGTLTDAGLRLNVAVGLGYLEAWLRGIGCVPLFNLMEDAATAEISRAQLWQWVHHHAHLEDGRRVTAELVDQVITEELALAEIRVDATRFEAYKHAAFLMRELVKAPHFQDFLTVPAYARVLATENFA